MSRETQDWLDNNILVGMTDKFGSAWHKKSGVDRFGRPNHFPGEVPMERIRELLNVHFSPRLVYYTLEQAKANSPDFDPATYVDPLLARVQEMVLTGQMPASMDDLGIRQERDRRAWANDRDHDVAEVHSEGYVGHDYGTALIRNT